MEACHRQKTCEGARALGDIPKQGDLHTSSEEKPTCFEKRLASGAPCLYPPGFLAPTYPCLPGTPATWLPGFNLASAYLASNFLLLLATWPAAARHLATSTPGVKKNKLPHGKHATDKQHVRELEPWET